MLLVVPCTEAQLANLDLRANDALILCIIGQLALAGGALEAPLVSLEIGKLLCQRRRGIGASLTASFLLRLSGFLALTPGYSVLFEHLEAHRTPVSSAERTCEGLFVVDIVLKAAR